MGPRLLIVAGEAATSGEQVPRGVRSLIDAAGEIMVVSPALPGRLDWIASDTDKATERADERLQTILGQLDEMGAGAHGRPELTIRCWRSRMRSASSRRISC